MPLTTLRFPFACLLAAALAACGSTSTASSPSAEAGAADAAFDAGAISLPDTDAGAITGLAASTWTWTAFPDGHCRDGSSTGIGLNVNPASKKLMIFLEGGGACFNATTCGMNPSCFAGSASDGGGCAATFDSWVPRAGNNGVFNRADAANPMKDWSFVYVPYCTGDVHAGNNPSGSVPGVSGTQQFVGYANMRLFLERIVPTFPGLSQVLLTGISAGGFGAAADYPLVAKAFGSVPVYDLDDSGPSMEDPYAAKCLQDNVRKLWGLDQTLLVECGADCPDPTNYQLDLAAHTVKKYPNVPFGLLDDTADSVISLFYGFGASNCTTLAPLTKATYTAGLTDIRTKLAAYSNVGSFIFDDSVHTTLSMGGTPSPLDTRAVPGPDGGTVLLTDWIAQLVNSGKVTNVGP